MCDAGFLVSLLTIPELMDNESKQNGRFKAGDLNRVHPECVTFNQTVSIPAVYVCITASIFILGME